MARIDGVPPRPPYSFGHWMPANPALALSASHLRRISNAWSVSWRRQNPRSRHSLGRLASIQVRNSVRNCSSASLKLRSTSAVLSLVQSRRGEPNGILLRMGRAGEGRSGGEPWAVRIRGFRGVLAGTLLAVAAVAPVALADNPVAPYDGGTAVQQCYAQASTQIDDGGYKFYRSLQALTAGAAAACRTPLRAAPDTTLPEWCGLVDGRRVSEAQAGAYEQSWVHEALTLQRGLDESAPLWEEQLPHTHNSFNASAYSVPLDGSLPSYYPTLTNQDPNQVYSMTDQLRMDVHALEVDLHWVPSPYGGPQTHGYWVTMCHGDGENPAGSGPYVHVGCTDDRPLQDGLAELARWLKAHPHDVVMLYLENQLFSGSPVASTQQAHGVAAELISHGLGRFVYQPPTDLPSGSCAPMPYDVSSTDILAAGKQVLLVGNCGPAGWNRWVFTRGSAWDESGNPSTYGAADCNRDQAAMASHSAFRRLYEESPWLEAMTDATQVLTADTTARMTACGVNIIGFDQLQPFDGRLKASVWSWAQGEPRGGDGACAYQGGDARFHSSRCDVIRHFACFDPATSRFQVTAAAGPWSAGQQTCQQQFPGTAFGVPPNGMRNAQVA